MQEATVTVFDITIPLWDYCTAHEWNELERLHTDRNKMGGARSDVEVIAMFAKSRLDKVIDVNHYMAQPVVGDDLNEAAEALVAPFSEGLKKRARRNVGRLAEALSDPSRIKTEIAQLSEQIKVLTSVLEELESTSDGSESEA